MSNDPVLSGSGLKSEKFWSELM
ncbi:uncharacterized protein METZ01_LOCUS441761 [marine metagenome]|uniref:Uncharacterized protein n=1 Tax=marine metagenome TaxID=408172 RepID=A0A382Z051_9ZZZZ